MACKKCGNEIVWMAVDLRTGARRNMPVDAGVGSDEVIRPRQVPDGNLRPMGTTVQGRYGPVSLAKYVPPGEGRYRIHQCPRRSEDRRGTPR